MEYSGYMRDNNGNRQEIVDKKARDNINELKSDLSKLSEEIGEIKESGIGVSGGQPIPVKTVSAMTDTEAIYIYLGNEEIINDVEYIYGYIYIYDTDIKSWVKSVLYGSSSTVDEETVKEIVNKHLEENSTDIKTLTINGQQYNGSKEVNIVIESSSGSSGGGSETASEEQLATGYIDAETYPTANVSVETGLTLADLKKYKRFLIREKGESNTALANFYFKLGTGNIFRNSLAAGYAFYKWLDDDRTLLKITDCFFGSPSGVPAIGSSAIARSFAWPVINITSSSSIQGVFDFSEIEDDTAINISSATVPTITYSWEIRGLTV